MREEKLRAHLCEFDDLTTAQTKLLVIVQHRLCAQYEFSRYYNCACEMHWYHWSSQVQVTHTFMFSIQRASTGPSRMYQRLSESVAFTPSRISDERIPSVLHSTLQ